MNYFACKIIFLGTVAVFAAMALLSMGNPTGFIALALGIVLFYIGGRNIYDQPAPRTSAPPICRQAPSVPGQNDSRWLGARQQAGVDDTVRRVGATVLIVLGSLAYLGIGIYLKLQEVPERPQPPRPVFSAVDPNTAELFLLGVTEATPEDYALRAQAYDQLGMDDASNRDVKMAVGPD